jgi:hypothetical protein
MSNRRNARSAKIRKVEPARHGDRHGRSSDRERSEHSRH